MGKNNNSKSSGSRPSVWNPHASAARGQAQHDRQQSNRGESKTRNPNIQQPAIRPEGTEGSEWDDFAWGADDL